MLLGVFYFIGAALAGIYQVSVKNDKQEKNHGQK